MAGRRILVPSIKVRVLVRQLSGPTVQFGVDASLSRRRTRVQVPLGSHVANVTALPMRSMCRGGGVRFSIEAKFVLTMNAGGARLFGEWSNGKTTVSGTV